MSAERFSEPHYQRAAERYLQTALTVLDAVRRGRPPSLSEVVDAMASGTVGRAGPARTEHHWQPGRRLRRLD